MALFNNNIREYLKSNSPFGGCLLLGRRAFYAALCLSFALHAFFLVQLSQENLELQMPRVSDNLPLKAELLSYGGNKQGIVNGLRTAVKTPKATILHTAKAMSNPKGVKIETVAPLPEQVVEATLTPPEPKPTLEAPVTAPAFGFGNMPNLMFAERRRGLFEPPSMPIPQQN